MGVDICLIGPPCRAFNHYRPPLALMLLASYLEKKGLSVEIIDPKADSCVTEKNKYDIVNYILRRTQDLNPKIIGISCYTPEYNDVIALAEKLKKNNKLVSIVVGGVHATLSPEDFIFKNSVIDYVVIGEGEVTFSELVVAILNQNKDFKHIKGIGFIDSISNEYFQTDVRPPINNLDEMPLPAYHKVDMKYYTLPNPYAIRGLFLSSFYILVGRGCPSNCTFCVSAELRKILAPKQSLRCRSAENVADEVEFLKRKYMIDSFYFIDDNFTLSKDLVYSICDELIKRKLNLIWACSSRINTLSAPLVKHMRKAGCVQLDLGIESGSDAVLRRLKKGITTNQIKDVFEICHKNRMRTFANILINVPDESLKEINETLILLNKIMPSVTSFNIFIPYLGTEIYKTQNVNLAVDEYYILGQPPLDLVLDSRFRFAKHGLDFKKFYVENHKKYNSILNFVPDYFSYYYIKQLIVSRKKKDYLIQIKSLFREYVKQVSQRE